MTNRWKRWRDKNARLVRIRSEGICEATDDTSQRCRAEAVDWHHVFGRRHIVAEPLASHHTMTAALCRDHHNAAHRNEPMVKLLQHARLEAAAAWFFAEADTAEQLERTLRANGKWETLEQSAGVGPQRVQK